MHQNRHIIFCSCGVRLDMAVSSWKGEKERECVMASPSSLTEWWYIAGLLEKTARSLFSGTQVSDTALSLPLPAVRCSVDSLVQLSVQWKASFFAGKNTTHADHHNELLCECPYMACVCCLNTVLPSPSSSHRRAILWRSLYDTRNWSFTHTHTTLLHCFCPRWEISACASRVGLLI